MSPSNTFTTADLAPGNTSDITSLQMEALSLIAKMSDKQLERAMQMFMEESSGITRRCVPPKRPQKSLSSAAETSRPTA